MIALGATQAAWAVDGTITITGEITDSTCKINSAAPPHNLLVTLPKISNSALKNEGDVAGATVFTLKLSDCPKTATKMRLHFEPNLTTDYTTGNLLAYTGADHPTTAAASIPTNLGTASNNVQIQLRNLNGSAIQIGHATQGEAEFTMQLHGEHNDGDVSYIAQYYKKGTATVAAGKLHTYVAFSLVYP